MTTTKITRDALINHNVCKDGLVWFDNVFPHGCTIEEALTYEGEINTQYVWWYYAHVEQDKRLLQLCKIKDSMGVHKAENIESSQGISKSSDLRRVNGGHWSINAYLSSGIDGSEYIEESKGISWSEAISKSMGISGSKGILNSSAISNSYAVRNSHGVDNSFGVLNSVGVSNALFASFRKQEYTIFGKIVTKERFGEVRDELFRLLRKWLPDYAMPEPWKKMPIKAREYVSQLPEFDAAMFMEITDIDLTKPKDEKVIQPSIGELIRDGGGALEESDL